jgi:hypothetical protein
VSPANNRGFVLFRQCGKSLMYNKKNNGPNIETVVHHILSSAQMKMSFLFGTSGFGLRDTI